MRQTHQHAAQTYFTDPRLVAAFDLLDELHTAASEDRLSSFTPMSASEIVGWLREFVYTAQETLLEIEKRSAPPPHLRLVK
ncbi:MAG: hypothetical protein ACUVSX_03830 [Aggregatilineales bacterium]